MIIGSLVNIVYQWPAIVGNAIFSFEKSMFVYLMFVLYGIFSQAKTLKIEKKEIPNHNYLDEINEGCESQGSMNRIQELSNQVYQNASKEKAASSERLELVKKTLDLSQQFAQTNEAITDNSQLNRDKLNDVMSSSNQISSKVEELNELLGNVANSTTDSMSLINSFQGTFDKINGIAGVISDISNQTNLLALNAAIEAARAGEAGRGFSIVAEEVKELVMKSGQSATEITDLLEDMSNSIEALISQLTRLNENVDKATSHGDGNSQTLNQAVENITTLLSKIATTQETISTLAQGQGEELSGVINKVEGLSADATAGVQGAMDNMDLGCQLMVQIDELNGSNS